jgi:Spy/CpxP family protein refolding chaperone
MNWLVNHVPNGGELMKPRATFLVLLAAVLVLPLFAQLAAAQMGGSAAPDKQEVMAKMEKLSSELQLTPQQKQQMMPILMEEGKKLKSIKADTSLGPMQKLMQMKEAGTTADAQIKPILSPDQYQKFEQIRTQEREEMIQKMRSGQE